MTERRPDGPPISFPRSWPIYLVTATVTGLILAFAWSTTRRSLEERERDDVAVELEILADAYGDGISKALAQAVADTEYWAGRPEVAAAVEALGSAPPETLGTDPAQRELRRILGPFLRSQGYLGYFVIAPSGLNLASSRDRNLGTTNLVALDQRSVFAGVRNGASLVSSPQPTDVPLGSGTDVEVTMFSLAPIGTGAGPLPVFTLRLDPAVVFSPGIEDPGFAESGEVYVVNQLGQMLSASSYQAELLAAGRISSPGAEALGMPVAVPGADPHPGSPVTVDEGFTEAAVGIADGRSGSDASGYLGYTGVDVVGAWQWLPDFGIGVVAEQPSDQALSRAVDSQRAVDVLAGVALALLMLAALAGWMRARRLRLLERRRHRYLALFRQVFDALGEAVMVADRDQTIVACNRSAADLFGYQSSDLVGEPLQSLIPLNRRADHEDHVDSFVSGSEARRSMAPEVPRLEGLHRTGRGVPVDITIATVDIEGERMVTATISPRRPGP